MKGGSVGDSEVADLSDAESALIAPMVTRAREELQELVVAKDTIELFNRKIE